MGVDEYPQVLLYLLVDPFCLPVGLWVVGSGGISFNVQQPVQIVMMVCPTIPFSRSFRTPLVPSGTLWTPHDLTFLPLTRIHSGPKAVRVYDLICLCRAVHRIL